MNVIAPLFILASALALIFYLRSRAKRRDGSSFTLPPHDYSDTSDDGLGSGVVPFQARQKAPQAEGSAVTSQHVTAKDKFGRPTADRRPADSNDGFPESLAIGIATGVPVGRNLPAAALGGVLHDESGQPRPDSRDGDGKHYVAGGRGDAPESSRASDERDRPGFGGGSSNFSSPDPGGSPSGDSGGGGGGE